MSSICRDHNRRRFSKKYFANSATGISLYKWGEGKLSNVTFIFSEEFLGGYQEDQNRQPRIDKPFLLGVVATIVAPQITFCFLLGISFAVVFAACAMSGSVLGIRSYRRFKSPLITLDLAAAAEVAQDSDSRREKVA